MIVALCDKSLETAKRVFYDCVEQGIRILTCYDEDFPTCLTKISSPVSVLYAKGTLPDWDNMLGIAVVGTRRCSEYGHMVAERISHELAAAGVTIISGMARGIDSVALKSAIRVGAPTIAVMGCGLDTAYPPENRGLMDDIIATGCALSEYPLYTPPLSVHFPQRNRIVSALSDGVLAIEAPMRSGTLITARMARESGRQLFSVPGNIFARNSTGTNELIKSGATAVTCAKDILDAFPIRSKNLIPPGKKSEPEMVENKPTPASDRFKDMSDEEVKVANLLLLSDMHIEELAARSKMTIAQLNAILTMLEINGCVQKISGNRYKYIPEED